MWQVWELRFKSLRKSILFFNLRTPTQALSTVVEAKLCECPNPILVVFFQWQSAQTKANPLRRSPWESRVKRYYFGGFSDCMFPYAIQTPNLLCCISFRSPRSSQRQDSRCQARWDGGGPEGAIRSLWKWESDGYINVNPAQKSSNIL